MTPIPRRPGWRGDPLWLADALRAFGVRVEERPGWKTWGNGDFGSLWGVMAHHTGHNNTSTDTITFGHSALRGLLSQIHLKRDGTAVMCGVGVAWHAGVGSWTGLPTNNANWHTIGVEANSDGTTPWPAHMLDAYYRTCAAICWVLGHSSLRTIGHKEWGRVQGKWDPGGIDMPGFRARVQHYIDHPPFMPKEADMSEFRDFWDAQVPSLVDPRKKFPRRDLLQLTDYHATLANIQSKQALDELKLVRDDLAGLAELIVATTKEK